MPQQKRSTKEEINKLIEFGQAIYENGLTDYRDAQFELIDALFANQRVNSFAELSLSPLCRRPGQVLTWRSRLETWPEPDAEMHFSYERWGQVHLRAWSQLHARQNADTVFTILRAEVHGQRDKRSAPVWLGFIGAAGYHSGCLVVV